MQLSKDDLGKLAAKYQEKADRAYDNYQATGISRYDRERRNTVEIYPDQTLLAICFQGMSDDGALTHEQSFDIPMNYCPNCGRKLGW